MNYRWFHPTLAGSFVIVWAATAHAQQNQQNWNIEVASGVATTSGDISSRLTNGWTFDLGAGYEINKTFELDGNFMFNGIGVSNQTLQALRVPSGNASVMSLTFGPKIHF